MLGLRFGSVSVPSPIVAVALVIVVASLFASARAIATATLISRSVSEPCPGVELEIFGSSSARLALLAHPPIAMVASRQVGYRLSGRQQCDGFD